MLDDHAGGSVELAHAFERGVRIGDVVVRELLALDLLGSRDRGRAGLRVHVEGGKLVRILAIAQVLALLQAGHERLGPALGRRRSRSQPATAASYSAVCAKVFAASRRRRSSGTPPAFKAVKHRAIVRGVDDDRDPRVILRGGPQHRRPADVDVLDASS